MHADAQGAPRSPSVRARHGSGSLPSSQARLPRWTFVLTTNLKHAISAYTHLYTREAERSKERSLMIGAGRLCKLRPCGVARMQGQRR